MSELTKIKGVGPASAKVFAKGGFGTVKDIARASVMDLKTIPGVGELRALSLIRAAQALVSDPSLLNSADAETASTSPAEKKPKKKSKKKSKSEDKKKTDKNNNKKKEKKGKSKNKKKKGKDKK